MLRESLPTSGRRAGALRGLLALSLILLQALLNLLRLLQVMLDGLPGFLDEAAQLVINGFNQRRSPDIAVVMEPYWVVTESKSATHGSPFSYDTHVPVIMMGPWFRPGRYAGAATVNDIAPTLANVLEVETPSGSVGRVLTEILAPQ